MEKVRSTDPNIRIFYSTMEKCLKAISTEVAEKEIKLPKYHGDFFPYVS
jgi:hypothetical protein